MHRTDRKPGVLTQVQFGFDREWLYVRLDAGRPVSDLLADGYQFAVTFLQPDGLRFTIRQTLGRLAGSFLDRRATDQTWVERGAGGARVAAGTVIEAALPLSDLRRDGRRAAVVYRGRVRPGAQRGRAATGQPAGGADGPRRTVRSAQLERVRAIACRRRQGPARDPTLEPLGTAIATTRSGERASADARSAADALQAASIRRGLSHDITTDTADRTAVDELCGRRAPRRPARGTVCRESSS